MSKKLKYTIIIRYDETDKTYVAEAPALSGCTMYGSTYLEALQCVLEVIPEWIETAKEAGWKIPGATISPSIKKKKDLFSLSATLKVLRYIASSPRAEYGGFDEQTIKAARSALKYLRAFIERDRKPVGRAI